MAKSPLTLPLTLKPTLAMKCLFLSTAVFPTLALAEQPKIAFRWQTVDASVGVGYGLAIADQNGDGRLDIFLADDKEVVCYPAPEFKRQVIAARLTPRDNVCVAAADINADGKAELAIGANWNPGNTTDATQSGATFFLQSENSTWSTPEALPHEPTVHRMRWVRCSPQYHALVVLPLHGRGNKNGEGPEGVKISSHLRTEAGWTHATVDQSLHITHNFDQRRLNSTGVDELLIGAKEGVLLAEPQAGGTAWKTRRLKINAQTTETEAAFKGVGEIRYWNATSPETFHFAAVEPFHGNILSVFRQSEDKSEWVRDVVDSDTLNQGHALACGDLLGLGSEQIVVGWREKNAEGKFGIRIYWEKTPASSVWVSGWLADGTIACEDLKLADLDADGDLDIIAAGRSTKNVIIGWNEK